MRKYGSKKASVQQGISKGHSIGKGSKRYTCALCRSFNEKITKARRSIEKKNTEQEIQSQLDEGR